MVKAKRIKVSRVAIYARISVASEESVSIERQIEAARQYAAARGWEVVLVEVDEGVSATRNKPEQRRGWRALLSSAVQFDAVIIWKVDRLARSVLDFMHADEALQERDAAVVAVEETVDMTTPQGRAFAQLLAVFAELEAATTAMRVTAARRAVIGMGRWPGGSVPFGYRNIPNPDGPGVVLAQDTERVPLLNEMVTMILSGSTLFAVARWLDTQVPPKRAKRWREITVEVILRNPMLVGQIPYTPGRKPGEPYEGDVFRLADGNPLIDPSLAIIDDGERAQLIAALDAGKRPGSRRPRSDIEATLLSGVAVCGGCRKPLYRASGGGGYRYYKCQRFDCENRTTVRQDEADRIVSDAIVEHLGDYPELRVDRDAGNPEVARLQAALEHSWEAVREARGRDRTKIMKEIDDLEKELDGQQHVVPSGPRLVPTGRTLGEAWEAAADDAERNAILLGVVSVEVAPARRQAPTTPDRFAIDIAAAAPDGEGGRVSLQIIPG